MIIDLIRHLGPTFFDIFGVLAFLYIIFFAQMLLRKRKLPTGFIFVLLLIGLIGFFIDLLFASSFLEGLM